MRLVELKPEWTENPAGNRYLDMQCPTCPRNAEGDSECGGIIIPVGNTHFPQQTWGSNGETDFEKLTVTPSIWHHCKSDPHFFIRDGEIQIV